jgi:hypothetical protein
MANRKITKNCFRTTEEKGLENEGWKKKYKRE